MKDGSLCWQVGEARITSIYEQELNHINPLIRGARPEAVQDIPWLRPNYALEDGTLVGVVQAFVIERGGKTIMVDTCVGDGKDLPVNEAWHKGQTGFLERFRAAGFDPDNVDVVLCTHMHLDHVGWNTYWDGSAWVPTFPNARYLFARVEFDYWATETAQPPGDPAAAESAQEESDILFMISQINVNQESIEPVFGAGLADVVDIPCEPVEGVELVPTPGHTPGHVSVRVSSDGEEAFITGDCFHHPCQIARPDWYASVDVDRERSTQTRWEVLGDLVDSGVTFIGTHFSPPTAGVIRRDGDTFIFDDGNRT